MGLQIKELLRRICINNGWSYAVFWRFDSSNPMLLIPEDAYYEPVRHSAILDSSSAMKNNWDALSEHAFLSQVKHEEERIALLIEKNHRVHMVGEGIIGQVASSGRHRWIFQDTYCEEQCQIGPVGYQTVFQDSGELQHQFSAGIKTIAIISVAAHGVVQFASTQKIMENLKVVQDIKWSFLQLKNVPGPFLVGNTQNPLTQTISSSETCQTFAPVGSSGNFYSEHGNIKSLSDDGRKDQMVKTPFSTILTESSNPSTLWSHHGSIQPHSMAVSVSSNPHITTGSADLLKKMALYTRNAPFCIMGQSQTVETESPSNSNSGNGNQFSVTSRTNTALVSDFSTLTSMEQRFLSGMGIQGLQNIFPSNAPSLVPYRATLSNLKKESILNSSFQTSGSPNIRTHPTPCEIKNDIYFQPSSSSRHVIGREQCAGHLSSMTSSFVLDHVKQSTDTELLQALNVKFPSHGLVGADGQTWFGDAYGKDVQKPMLNSLSSSISSVKENRGSVAVCDGKQKSLNAPSQLPQIDELFDSSGLDLRDSHQQTCWDDIMLPLGGVNWSDLNAGVSELDTVSMIGLEKGFFSEIGSDQLLDAVVANHSCDTNKSSDDLLSKSTLTRASSGSLYNSSGHFVGPSCVGENVDNFLPDNGERTAWGSQREMLSRSQISSWFEQSQSNIAENAVFGQSKNVKEPPKVTRKRAKPGESTRPRPKDRQQIQDRVKELREIVPNGEKCSIDALLDRTIRHLRFLQSVTKHADKLKQAGEPKMIGKESGMILKDALEGGGGGGATWAFEVGGQSRVCPILVEDLNPPGQMLVEMLCEERGFFLEIADKIRGFGLTILKGTMEARDGKIWARFVVEANKEVTRMDISLSLVQLLEQTAKNSQSGKVIETGEPVFTTYQQSPMPFPISLAERLQ